MAKKQQESLEAKSTREALEAAFEEEEAGGSGEDPEESVGAAEEEDTTYSAEGEVDEGTEDDELDAEDEESAEETDEPEGLAAKDDDAGESAADDTARPADGDESGDSGRAPVSWSPKTREHWAKLPKEVKAEVEKREKEVAQALGQSANARRFVEEFSRTVAPYEGLIRAQGATPLQAFDALMEIGAGLRMGTQMQRAQIISNLVKQYDIDVSVLDEALSGQINPQTQQASEVERLVAQRMAPFQSYIQKQQVAQQQAQMRVQEEIGTEIGRFASDKKNEFFGDVRNEMADILEMAGQRGQAMTIKEAYDRACKLNPDINAILEQRAKARSTRENHRNMSKKRSAASSIKGTSRGGSDTGPATLDRRSALEQAWEASQPSVRKKI